MKNKRCLYCINYDLDNEKSVLNPVYGNPKAVIKKGYCIKKNDYIYRNSFCENFEVDQKFIKYKAYQEIGYEHENKFYVMQEYSLSGYSTKEKALKEIRKKYDIAAKKFAEFIKDYNELKNKYNCFVSYYMEGDTYGIDLDYHYVEIDGFNFVLDE